MFYSGIVLRKITDCRPWVGLADHRILVALLCLKLKLGLYAPSCTVSHSWIPKPCFRMNLRTVSRNHKGSGGHAVHS